MNRVLRGILILFLSMAAVAAQVARVGGGDVTFQIKGADPVTFSHENHVAGAGMSCQSCHDRLFVTRAKHRPVTMAQMIKKPGQSCGACHNGQKAFDIKDNCAMCHAK